MILIALLSNLEIKKSVSAVEVNNIRAYSCKMNKLQNIHTIGRGLGTSSSRNGKLIGSKFISSRLS